MIESLLLAATRVFTFEQQQPLTNASGFFFQRDGRLFLVTSRHVLIDEPSKHFPNRIEIELHIEPTNMAVIEIERAALPKTAVYRAFTPQHLHDPLDQVAVGTPLLMAGFPLGFHDTLHHMPVVRHAVVASSFGLRFQGQGYFLTDARTHRGTSGAPVVTRAKDRESMHGDLPWILLGVHSAVIDVGTRDLNIDEALGLNCAWYADILLTLTDG